MPDSGWLDALTLESFAKNELPVQEILQGSVYYPASGTDGSPVRHWWLDARSFVYADISESEESYIQASQERPFKGYRIWGRRRVELIELTSARTSFASPPSLELSAYHRTLKPLHGHGARSSRFGPYTSAPPVLVTNTAQSVLACFI